MTPPVWVLDTNVVVSAALTSGGACDQCMRAVIAGRARLAWSAPMLAAYRAVLLKSKFQLSPETVTALLAAFDLTSQVTPSSAPQLPDRDDEVFLAAALATGDRILVTGITAHFPVRVISPREALLMLGSS